jgi:autotransporter passenger strand-loop-strand repeat protein/uncharacterized repeat protein (TIGR03803 family)
MEASMTSLTILYSFNNSLSGVGDNPRGALLMDAAGNLFGTLSNSSSGGSPYGGVFELAATGNGYASTPTSLVKFDFDNGAGVIPDLVTDADGNLFGDTYGGGPNGYGELFELVKTSTGYTQTILYGFTSSSHPTSGDIVIDAAGNLFGTATGGPNGAGVVYELAKTANGYASAPTTIVASYGTGITSYSTPELMIDSFGNLLGTTQDGGENNKGTVYEIAKTATGYANTPTVIYSFDGVNGSSPGSNLLLDADGNLFGTTGSGGAYGHGTVFEIAKTASGYGAVTTLVSLTSGANHISLMDAAGNLYGTANSGPNGNGSVYEIAKINGVYASTPITLAVFNGANGSAPFGGLIMDASGALYGTTVLGGANNAGTIFKLTLPTPLAVSVTGSAQEGQTLAANPNQDVVSYQWQVLINGIWNNITGATGATYLVRPVDDGRQIRVGTTNSAGFTATSAATNAVLDAAGNQPVYESADQTTIGSGQVQLIYGHAAHTTVNSGGLQNIYANGTATVTAFNAGGVQQDWGAASTTTLDGGQQFVFGTADSTVINSGGQVVESGGAVSLTTIHGGEQDVYGGGTATGTTMDGGSQLVYGAANQTTLGHGAIQYLHGAATTTIINAGGQQNVYADGTTTGTTINAGGYQIDWGAATGTTISGGTQYVYGTATDTTVTAGIQHVQSGGLAIDTTIGTGQLAYVHDGGAMDGVTFAGPYAILGLDRSSALTGTISGWQANDYIDLGEIQFSDGITSLAYLQNEGNGGGSLSVSDGTHTATLHLLGQYGAADFGLSSDGHGGTLISDPAVAQQAQLAPALHG